MMTPPIRIRARITRPPLHVFPPRSDPDPDPPSEAGVLRRGFLINGHLATVCWWRRQPPPDVADAVQLEPDFWIALRVD